MTTTTMTPQTKLQSIQSPIRNAVVDIIRVLEDFTALLKCETTAAKKSDFKTMDLLQSDKRAIARQYQDMVSAIGLRREEMAHLEISLREKLITTRTTFTIVLNENMRALENMRHSTKRLADKIMDVARHSVTETNQTNYSAKGKMQSYKSSTLSLSLDQSL